MAFVRCSDVARFNKPWTKSKVISCDTVILIRHLWIFKFQYLPIKNDVSRLFSEFENALEVKCGIMLNITKCTLCGLNGLCISRRMANDS